MSDVEFVKLGQEMLYQIQKVSNIQKTCNLFPQLEKLKLYIYNNPDNQYVKQFIEVFIELYAEAFFNKDLIDSFAIPEQYHYYKQIRIYMNLPYTLHPFYAQILPKTLVVPSEVYGDFYRTFLWVLQKYRPHLTNNPHLNSILNFVDSNKNIMRGSKDDYDSLVKEVHLYHQATSGYHLKELDDFAFMEQCMDIEKVRRKFINKKIGNIGELYVYKLIKDQYFHYFVSRDIKNGFGYDIYYFDGDSVENLVEVKTTMNHGQDDCFKMSENEYNVMIQCFNNPCARYYICRVELDSSLNPSYTLLSMKDEETLANAETEYKLFQSLNGERYFRKQDQKKKIIIN